jgi:RNA polymerase sigma-70 factor (ECF subfamily)
MPVTEFPMASDDSLPTSPSLLERLRNWPRDEAAWDDFVKRYGPRIYGWCQRWGLQPADIQDVAQDVLLALTRQMADFVYDDQGSFRAWLKTVTYRAWCRFAAGRPRDRGAGGTAVQALLNSVPARDDFLRQLEQESDWLLLDMAMARVRRRVSGSTWEAFRLQALEGWSGTDVARRLDMRLNAVYAARSNVQKLLKEELRRLQPEEQVTAGA